LLQYLLTFFGRTGEYFSQIPLIESHERICIISKALASLLERLSSWKIRWDFWRGRANVWKVRKALASLLKRLSSWKIR
jgi:hypothetical protein